MLKTFYKNEKKQINCFNQIYLNANESKCKMASEIYISTVYIQTFLKEET